MAGLQAPSPELQALLEEVIRVSRGSIEVAIVSKPDGTPVAHVNASSVGPEYLGAAISAISGVVSAILEVMHVGDYRRIVVELNEKRYLFIIQHRGDVVALITRLNPNLGFINLLLDLYFKEEESIDKL
ncbi:MAG: roadblock/LC7 domain-containing protein [Nitrososphaerota archaeon]|nr:roadblock/LC7 domain-containing protein [Candidatus Calditenuaceae archaeon]MDW8073168.1 roadblock/LC7 domain-containing protein [Nitrososphaerota archaeon]